MNKIPFTHIDWSEIEKTEHAGEKGTSFWQTIQLGGLRIRLVEYSENYLADHWCQNGHIVHCLEGAFYSELEHSETVFLSEGMFYVVSDDMSVHRSKTISGAKIINNRWRFSSINQNHNETVKP